MKTYLVPNQADFAQVLAQTFAGKDVRVSRGRQPWSTLVPEKMEWITETRFWDAVTRTHISTSIFAIIPILGGPSQALAYLALLDVLYVTHPGLHPDRCIDVIL